MTHRVALCSSFRLSIQASRAFRLSFLQRRSVLLASEHLRIRWRSIWTMLLETILTKNTNLPFYKVSQILCWTASARGKAVLRYSVLPRLANLPGTLSPVHFCREEWALQASSYRKLSIELKKWSQAQQVCWGRQVCQTLTGNTALSPRPASPMALHI